MCDGLTFPEVGGKQLGLVRVPKSLQEVYVTDGPNKSFYVRSGNTTQALNIEEAHSYIREHF